MKYETRVMALSLVIAAVSAGLPSTLFAQVQQPPGPMTFSALDKNGDGFVTAEEFATAHGERMATRAAQGAPMRGAVNATSFADFDQNGDGRMTPEEFEAARQARRQGRSGAGPGAMMGPGMGMGMGMGRAMPTFDEFDLNRDGTLTETEFYEARAKRMAGRAQEGYPLRNAGKAPPFGDFDSNGNGSVTPEEFAAAQASHRQQMMQRP